jgi:flagellin
MPIGVLNNIPSLEAENELTLTASALNSTLEQLSSGSRINSGADDPAGLSIANGLEANIAALTQSVSNANDGVGELQLADGALAQVTNLLNTAVTLATESATGTVSNSQRTAIQAQYASILAEVNQIGTATTYNGQSVFQSGSAPNLNAADSTNSATNAPITLNTVLTTGSVTSVTAGGVTFSYTAGTTTGANANVAVGNATGLTASTVLLSGASITLTRATGTTTYTATAATTVGALETAINVGGATPAGFTQSGTDTAGHTGYSATLTAAGSLQLTDLNSNNDLAVTDTGVTNTNQVTTNVGNLTANTALAAGTVLTLTRGSSNLTSIYTVQTGGSTVGALEALINAGTANSTVGNIVITGTDTTRVTAPYTAGLSAGNLQITDSTTADADLTAVETGGPTNLNEATGSVATLTAATALNAGDVFTAHRATGTTTYTVAAGATVANLLTAINTGANATDITVAGSDTAGHTNYAAQLSAATGALEVTDINNNNDLTFTDGGVPDLSKVTTNFVANTLTGASTVASGEVITLTRGNGLTSTYTSLANTSTVTELIADINSGTTDANFTVGGTDSSHAGYTAALTGANPNQLTITDNTGNGTLTATDSSTALGPSALTTFHGPAQAGTFTSTQVNGGLGTLTDSTANPVGSSFTTNPTATSTVQSLVNAINADTTVGAKATVTNGQLVITDPLDRNDLTATTTDTVLGALVEGAASPFLQPTNTGTATPDTNAIVGNAGSLTADSTLTGVASFTAGGKTFTFTANGQPGGDTVGDLINAINSPTDSAGLTAYLTNGNLEVVDPNNNGNIAVGSANTTTVLGTFANPSTTASSTTNIFLSDSTAIGSTEIAVTIGGLSASGITNGSGTGAVNLASTDLSSAADAQAALVLINAAISNVASVRGTLGASVNRLTAASNVINSQVQNLTSAENTITAADIPTVVANLTKYSILEQTGISALAQANQQQQLVLKLLQ